MPVSMDEFIRQYSTTKGNGTSGQKASQQQTSSTGKQSMGEFIRQYATVQPAARGQHASQQETPAPKRASSAPVVPEAEQRRQSEREAASANRANARTSYTDLRNTRDSIKAKADDMMAEYDRKISAGASKEELADEYAKIMKQYGLVTDYDQQVADAYAALKQADQEYKDVYAGYNAARQEVKAAKRNLRDVESQYAGWATDDLSAQNVEQTMNNAEDVKAARTRLANAREAYIAQGGNPDANIVSAGLKGSAAGVMDTFGYLQELGQPENEKRWGIFTTGHMTEQQRHHQEVLQQREKEQYEAEHGAGTYQAVPGYIRTQNIAAELQRQSGEQINSMKAGRSELGQFAVDMGVQGVQMGADAVVGKVIPGGSLTAMALRSFGSGVREAREAGANIYQQGLYGAGTAAVEVLTEKMFDGLAGIYGAGAADDIVSHAIGRFTQNRLGQAALGMVADAAGEGLEEVISDLANPVLRSIYDEHVFDNGYFGALNGEEILYDFLVGAAMGFVGGSVEGVTKATGIAAEDERSKFFMQAGQDGMKIGDAMRMWQKHLIKEGYATQTGDQNISNRAAALEQSIDEKKFDPFRERKINRLNQQAASTVAREDMRNTLGAVEQRMQQLGEENGALAEAITMVALEGEAERIGARDSFATRKVGSVTATEAQHRMVEASPIAQRILSEMDVENLRGERAAEYNAFLQNKGQGATREDYERAVAPYQRSNEWVKTMPRNKALASDVYGAKTSVSAEEKTGNVQFTNKGGHAINGEIVGVKDGKVRIKHGKDGKTIQDVEIDQIQGISEGYRTLLQAVSTRKNGSVMLAQYKPGQNINSYLMQWDIAENGYGLTNITDEKARQAYSLRDLTDAQLKMALELGRAEAKKQGVTEEAKQQKVTGKVEFWDGKGKIDGMEYDSVTEEEAKKKLGDAEYAFASEVLAKIVNVTLVKSKAVNGSYVGAQGIFFRDGRIYLDVNAGMDTADVGQRTIVLTAAHELTHYIRAYNEEAYNALRDFVVTELVNQGKNLEDFIRQKQRRAGGTLTHDEALEEVIADACERMLTDGEQIMAFANEHTTEARGIWKWLDKFYSKWENAFKGLKTRHAEAEAMQGRITELRQMWLDALAGANENALASQASDPTDTIVESKTDSGFTSSIQSDGTIMNSLRTFDESGRENLDAFLDEQVQNGALTEQDAKQMRTQIEELYKVCKDYDNGEYAPFSAWSNAQVVSIDGKPVFSVVKANGEYKLNLDFSLVCKKRRTLDAVFNEMIRRGIMNDFRMGQGSIARINEIIRDHGFEVACGLCFVDSKRYRQAMIADAFCKMYNMQVFSLLKKGAGMKLDSFNYGGDATIVNSGAGIDTLPDADLNWEKIDIILKTEKKGTVKWKIANYLKENPQARKLVARGDFMSTAGFDALKIHNPELLSLYNSKKGAGGPKAAQSDVQYLNEIIQQGQFNAKAAYEVGGIRIQSFSDYVGRLVFDYVQMVADLSAKKLPAHSYTKEFMFAQQFGLTGIKINMSLVPEVVKGIDKDHAGLDADGNYTWKDGQSFGSTVYDNHGKRMTAAEGFELAKRIQNAEGYSKNCGTIAVGVSRAHIEKMLDDPEIRMIIPYHKSGLNHLVAAMNQIDKYTDYTNSQNTRQYKNGKWSKISPSADFNWNDALQRAQAEGKGARETANEYLDWCKEHGYKPKFDEFAGHPNYYKLLEDFSCYDKDGTTSTPLGAVQMNFPTENDAFGSMKDLIKAGLEEDAMLQAKQEGGVDSIVDEIEAVLPGWEMAHPEGKTKSAVRSSASNAAVKYSAREDIRKMDIPWDSDEKSTIKTQLNRARPRLMKQQPVRIITYDASKNDYLQQLDKTLRENFGYKINRQDGVSFLFDKGAVSKIDQYINTDGEKAAAIAAPYVLKRGEIISGHKHHKGGLYPSLTFGASVEINGKKGVEAVTVLFGDKDRVHALRIVDDNGDSFELPLIKEEATPTPVDSGVRAPVAVPIGVTSDQNVTQRDAEVKGKKSDRDINTLTTKADIDAEISRVQDQIRDIQNAQWNAVETAKKDPRVQDAQQKMWAAEDAKGYSGALKERMAYRRILKEVKEELAADAPQGDLQELADRVNELKALREQYLKVTPITAAQYNKLAKHFGTTDDYGVAGFILQDGRMLDFSGKKQYGSAYAGGREVYHNEVGDVLNLPTDNSPRIDMVSNGNIRLVPEINGINLSQKPTAAQKAALRGFIDYNEGSVHVDIDNAAGRTVESFGYYKGTSASKVLADIDRYFATGETPAPQSDLRAYRSLRDTEAAVQQQKQIGRERLDKLRAEKNAKIEQIRKEETARRQAAVKREKAAKWQKVAETKEHYKGVMKRQRNRRSDTNVRGKIKALHKELTDMLLKPKEGRYVPKDLVKATAEILGAVDTTSGRAVKAKAALAQLKVQYDALAQDPKYSLTYDETVSGMLQEITRELGDGSIYDLTGSELEGVYNVLKALKHTIQTANKLVGAQIEADAFEAANQMMRETENAKGIPMKALRKFVMAQMTPASFFRMAGGYVKNSMWEQMFGMLNQGQLTQTQVLMEGGQIFRELIDDKKNLDTLHDQKNLVDIGLKDDLGNSIKITRGMMLSVYMHLQNEQNARHISYGGLTVPRLKQYYKNQMADAFNGKTGRAVAFATEIAELNQQLSEAETEQERTEIQDKIAELQDQTDAYMSNLRAQIEKQLTEYDRKWIAAAQKFFDEYSKNKLNEVTEMVYGFSKAQVDHYFPIHTDANYRAASFDTIVRDMSLENAGFMKERINGANPILLEDITDVISSQLRRTAQYVGLMPAVRNFNKAYGKARAGYSMSVQSAMARTFENEGKKYIENLMADLNGARKTEANIFDELRGNMAGAVLTFNPRVTLAQAASFPSAAAEIGYTPLMKALTDMKNPMWDKGLQDEIAKWTPLWWYRMQGYSTTELGDIKNNEQFMAKVMDKMKWATGWIQAADGLTTGGLWQASKYYVDENFSDLQKGSDEYMMKVAEVYNRVLEKTQPDYTTMQRPDILRNPNAIVKQLTMFMTQRLQNMNILYDAAATYSHYARDMDKGRNGVTAADVKQAKTRLIWAVSSQVAASATIVIFKALADALMHSVDAYRDDDDELTAESVSKTMLTNFAETITSNVLWGAEAFSWLKSALTGERYYGVSLNGVDTFTDMLSDGNKLIQKLIKGDLKDAGAPAWKLTKAVSQFFGAPLGNAEKFVKMIANNIEDAKNGDWGTFEAGVDRTKAQNTHLLFDALQAGDTARADRLKENFKDEKDVRSSLKGYIKELYTGEDQQILKDETIRLLQQYCGMTRRDAESTAQEWTMLVREGINYSDLNGEFIAGNVDRAHAIKYLQDYKSMTRAEAEAKVLEWQCEKDTGIAFADIGTEVKTGRLGKTKALAMVMKYGGKSEEAADKQVEGWLIEHEYNIKPSELQEEYMDGNVSVEDAFDILVRYQYNGKEDAEEKAYNELVRWNFIEENPGTEDITVTQIQRYQNSGLEGVVDGKSFLAAYEATSIMQGVDTDGDGKANRYTKVDQQLAYIDGMDLTGEQKTSLAIALGINETTVRKRAPWNKRR